MGWDELDPDTRAAAERVLTAKELDALKLWTAGAGYRRIGRILGIAPTTAKDRIERAQRKLADTLETHQEEER